MQPLIIDQRCSCDTKRNLVLPPQLRQSGLGLRALLHLCIPKDFWCSRLGQLGSRDYTLDRLKDFN
jgi:hypothetical protein